MKYLLLLLSVFSITACQKSSTDAYMERKIKGTWVVEEVKEQKFLENNNITGESDDYKFEFRDDHQLVYTNRNNQSYNGTWDLTQNYYSCGDNSQIDYLINIHVSDPASGLQKIYSGNNLSVTKKCMSFNHQENNVSFRYKLKRD